MLHCTGNLLSIWLLTLSTVERCTITIGALADVLTFELNVAMFEGLM